MYCTYTLEKQKEKRPLLLFVVIIKQRVCERARVILCQMSDSPVSAVPVCGFEIHCRYDTNVTVISRVYGLRKLIEIFVYH